jgi:hypothetical protein
MGLSGKSKGKSGEVSALPEPLLFRCAAGAKEERRRNKESRFFVDAGVSSGLEKRLARVGGEKVNPMRILLAAAAILPLFSSGCSEGVSVRAATDDASKTSTDMVENRAPLSCTIRGEPTCKLGNVPDVSVVITNQTKTDIYLVGSLDGSHCKWRYPFCYFEVIRPDGRLALPPGKGCGHANELREKDFVKVPPGGTFDPYQEIDEGGFFLSCQLTASAFRTAGEYRIRFVYSTKYDDIIAWVGDGVATAAEYKKLLGMFRQVPKVEIRSNEIKIRIVKGGK